MVDQNGILTHNTHMQQQIQHTDAYILMRFGDVVRPVKQSGVSPTKSKEFKAAGEKAIASLVRNGHSHSEAISLLRDVWERA